MTASTKNNKFQQTQQLAPPIETYKPFLEDVEAQVDTTNPNDANVAHANHDYLNSQTTDTTDPTQNLSGFEDEGNSRKQDNKTKPSIFQQDKRNLSNPKATNNDNADDYYKTKLPNWMTPWRERTASDETALRAKEKPNVSEARNYFTEPNPRDDPDHDQDDRDDFLQETQTQMDDVGLLPDVKEYYKSKRSPDRMTRRNERTTFAEETPYPTNETTNAADAAKFFRMPSTPRDDPDHDRERDEYLKDIQTQMDGGMPDADDYYNSGSPDWIPGAESKGFNETANTGDDPDHDKARDDFLQETQKQMDGGLPDTNDNYKSRSPDWMTPWRARAALDETALKLRAKRNSRERNDYTQENQTQMNRGLTDADDYYNSRPSDWMTPREEPTGFKEPSLQSQEQPNSRDFPERYDYLHESQAPKDESLPDSDDYYNSSSPDWMTPREEPTGFKEPSLQSQEQPRTRDFPDTKKDYLQENQSPKDGILPDAADYYNSSSPDWMTPREEPAGFKEPSFQSVEQPNTRDFPGTNDYVEETQTPKDGILPDDADYYNSSSPDWMTPREEPAGFKEQSLRSVKQPNTRDFPGTNNDYLQETQTPKDGIQPDAADYYNSSSPDWMTPREEPAGFKEQSLRSHEQPDTHDYSNQDREGDDYLQDAEEQQRSSARKDATDNVNVTKNWCCRPSSLALFAMLASLLIIAIAVPLALSARNRSASEASDNFPPDTPVPTFEPTVAATAIPVAVTDKPAVAATATPTLQPVVAPTATPTLRPAVALTTTPTLPPAVAPTATPTAATPEPAIAATSTPTPMPTVATTPAPSRRTPEPTVDATTDPTPDPTDAATMGPTLRPTSATLEPSISLTPEQIGCNFLSLTALSDCRDAVGHTVGDAHESGSTIPSEIGLLTQMAYMSFRGERLTGSIPSSMSNLTRLALLDISSNRLTGSIPASICSQMALVYIDCGEIECDCCLSGDSPYKPCTSPTQTVAPISTPTSTTTAERIACNFLSISNLDECRTTLEFASYNGMHSTSGSTIPSEIGLLTQLTRLDFYNNHLTGSIPSSLYRLTQLSSLNFTYNDLTGSIPSMFSDLTQLVNLDFSFNKLTGSIPSSVSKLTRLTDLAFTANKLTGTIPSSLSNLSQLARLAFTRNLLTGSIPMFLESLSQLVYFSVYNNSLTGSIPSSLCSHVTSPFIDCGEIECSCCFDYFFIACT